MTRPTRLAWRKGPDDNGGDEAIQPPWRAGMVLTLPALLAAQKPGQRLLGLDPGSKMIGVAVSDVGRMIASPHTTLRRAKLAVNAVEILALAQKLNVGGLVIGLPLSMDGTLGPAAQSARDWARALSDATGLPASLWDERLSSAAVNRFLIKDADLSRGRRAALVDRTAAAYLLQAALDASGSFGENHPA